MLVHSEAWRVAKRATMRLVRKAAREQGDVADFGWYGDNKRVYAICKGTGLNIRCEQNEQLFATLQQLGLDVHYTGSGWLSVAAK